MISFSGLICLISFTILYNDYFSKELEFYSYLSSGFYIVSIVYMVISYTLLNGVINKLFDGKLSYEFNLLRTTFFILIVCYSLEALFLGMY